MTLDLQQRRAATTSGCTSRAWAATARGADHRARRRLLPRGLERQALPRRARRAVRRADRLLATARRSAQAALEQMRELPFYTNWSYAHPRAIELAHEVASLAPGDLNRVFFVSGGSEAVESAWKLARQYHAARGERRWKAVARRIAYHGTTMGALSINGIAALQNAVRAARPGHAARAQHEPLPPPAGRDRGGVHRVPARRPRAGDPRRRGRTRSRW